MDSITQTIAEYASTLVFEHLTGEAVHAAKQRLIDSLGCAVGAHDCEPAQIGRRLADGQTPGRYPGRVLYFGDRLPVESAAFINTSMIRAGQGSMRRGPRDLVAPQASGWSECRDAVDRN